MWWCIHHVLSTKPAYNYECCLNPTGPLLNFRTFLDNDIKLVFEMIDLLPLRLLQRIELATALEISKNRARIRARVYGPANPYSDVGKKLASVLIIKFFQII